MTTPDSPAPAADPPKKTRGKKLASAIGALVVVAVGALFTGIGEGAVNRLMDAVTSEDSQTGPALAVAVRTDIGAADDLIALPGVHSDGAIAVALKNGKVTEPWEAFLARNDGAPVDDVVVTVVVTGRRDPNIRIVDIGVAKLSAGPVLAGTSIQLITQGQAESIKLTANLDEEKPRILTEGVPYFPDRSISLKGGEQETLKFTVTASKMSYRWLLAIDYVDETGAPQRVYINRVGKIFAQAADSPAAEAFTLTGSASKYGAGWLKNHPLPGFSAVNG